MMASRQTDMTSLGRESMELYAHNISALFGQLGLDNSDDAIEAFIIAHRPVPENLRLHEAEFWSSSQADFLHEAIDEDADWAEVVDILDTMLRA